MRKDLLKLLTISALAATLSGCGSSGCSGEGCNDTPAATATPVATAAPVATATPAPATEHTLTPENILP